MKCSCCGDECAISPKGNFWECVPCGFSVLRECRHLHYPYVTVRDDATGMTVPFELTEMQRKLLELAKNPTFVGLASKRGLWR